MLYNKQEKVKKPAFFMAQDYLKAKNISFKIPQNVILMPFTSGHNYIKSISKKRYNLLADIDILSDNTAVVSNFSLGAPLIAALAEILRALGAENFVLLGVAGALNPDLRIGDTVLCSGAICDEGTSPNYTAQEFAPADESLIKKLSALEHKTKGTTWTTDALFRETEDEVAFYQKQDVKTVEMEAAAVFALAQHHNLKAAAVFIISDLLFKESWQLSGPGGKNPKQVMDENLKKIIKILG